MMFRKFLAIFLIACLQSLSFAGLLANAGFKLNKKYIARVLCENRAKPKLNCMGKCYLKKMQKNAEREKAVDNLLKEIQLAEVISSSYIKLRFYPISLNLSHSLSDSAVYAEGFPEIPFHPPGFI